MYNVTDFQALFNALCTNTRGTIDPILYSIAISERTKTISFFANTLDQVAFKTDDYGHLRSLFINWYATHRAFVKTQQITTDVHSMPSAYLNELFFSFGFNLGSTLNFISKENRNEFFLRLVDLYKAKGTPRSLFEFLEVAGLPDIELLEYWITKVESPECEDGFDIIFDGKVVKTNTPTQLLSENNKLDYDVITQNDPHWFMTKDQIRQLLRVEKIQFPSKTPYFSVRFAYDVDDMSVAMAYLHRIVIDQYKGWVASGYSETWEAAQRTIKSECSMDLSILEVFLGANYMLQETFGRYDIPTLAGTDLYWAGDSTASLTQVYTLYKALTASDNTSISQIDIKRSYYNALFTISAQDNPFTQWDNNPGELIRRLNPAFKVLIDNSIFVGEGDQLLYYLFDDLTIWVAQNLGGYAPAVGLYTLDVSQQSYVANAIDFFKPYRARLVNSEKGFKLGNRLFDQVLIDDEGEWLDFFHFNDYLAGDSSSVIVIGSQGDSTSVQWLGSSRDKWDLGGKFDVGACLDRPYMDIEDTYDDIYDIHRYDTTTNITDATQVYYCGEYIDSTGRPIMLITGGFVDFDRGWQFDRPPVMDYVTIGLYDTEFLIIGRYPPPHSTADTTTYIEVFFSEDVDPTTVTSNTFYVDEFAGSIFVDEKYRFIETYDADISIGP